MAAAPYGVHHATETEKQAWVAKASAGLQPCAIDALRRVVGADRRLLAVRAYLRAGDSLLQRWSWSQERLSAYPSTAEGKAAAADIDAVSVAFAAANPGFSLQVNRQPRSLELQIAHWNDNASVAAVAAELVASVEQQFAAGPANPDPDELRKALIDWKPSVAASLAAPGLSAHGQGRAFDFEIVHEGRVIAGTEASSARQNWDAAGWTYKLHKASVAVDRFSGPLQSPYEPWHYTYVPAP